MRKLGLVLLLCFLLVFGRYYGEYLKGPARWRENTILTRGYSEKKFACVRTGMTKTDVKKILGEPLSGPCKYTWFPPNQPEGEFQSSMGKDRARFLYAMPKDKPEYVAFHWREVVFDQQGKVSRTVSKNVRPSFLTWFLD